MKHYFIKRLQRGISLLEVLLSLSIIAIILVMATRYFFLASDNDKINMTRQEVGSLIAGVQAWKGQNTSYNTTDAQGKTLSIATLYDEGFLTRSSSLALDGTTLYDPWGDKIELSATAQYVTIAIQFQKLKYCMALKNSYPYGECATNQFTLKYPEQTT